MQGGELPLFVPDAIVEHVIPLSLMGCLRKDIRSVYLMAWQSTVLTSEVLVFFISDFWLPPS